MSEVTNQNEERVLEGLEEMNERRTWLPSPLRGEGSRVALVNCHFFRALFQGMQSMPYNGGRCST